ncbi:UNVERIFIED_CONTAM: hypothetical protein Scaly_3144100 [Sesamum calycinum]|uniref:Aminotransferase-like plant mobile domain-containing protein n=1 Tax=Sesamum calycinum TaxID=2727403 RepID=A0AAW2JGD9_9LAMI
MKKRERFIPRSCKYLLYAYHLLQSADDNQYSHVSIDKWVKFWSKKTTKYHSPPPRKEKKTIRPESTHNSLGYIAIHERWSTAEEALFAKLCIERSIKEEVYLAAYLACWLCVFVLPGKDVNSIHPSTFKMASLMENGRRVNLAIPVLASIYEGLNTVATSPKPAGTSHSFPIHFVYAWLACYFKTHYSVWQELRGPKMTRFSGEGGRSSLSMMVVPKSSVIVTLLQFVRVILLFVKAADSSLLHIVLIDLGVNLGTIKMYQEPSDMTHVASLEEGLRYCRLCVLSKSSSKAWFPCLPANAKKLCSEAYKAWSAKIHGTFFDDNIACLIRPKSIKITLKHKKDEDKQVDGGENDPPHTLIPPIVIECDSQAAAVEASKGKCSSHNVADSNSSNKDRHWKRQREEVTPLNAMETNENASRSSLANFVAELEDEVQSIDVGEESETSHSSTMTPPLMMGLRRKQSSPPAAVSVLKEVKARLQDVQAKASEEASEIQSAMDELEHVEEDIAVLKGRRTNLRTTLKEKKQLNHDTQAKVYEVEKDLAALESTAPR